jgi:hypothetical protein
MELQHIEISEDKDFDYSVNAQFEDFRVVCYVDAETSTEDEDQTIEEIEAQGKRFRTVVDSVSFLLVQYFELNDVKISLSTLDEKEVKHIIENEVTNLIQEI